MAKSIYIGVDGKARKAKNIYIGVDGKARKVKKMYIGVNGVARLCYTSEVTVTVTIVQSANQTITVICNGNSYTSTFTAEAGSTYTASISASTGYNAGKLSSTSGTLTDNITISATAATLKTYTYTINQPKGGTITVTVDGVAYTSTFTVQHGKTASNLCTPNSGYTFKTFTLSGSYQTASANTLAINGDAEIGAVLEKENEDV